LSDTENRLVVGENRKTLYYNVFSKNCLLFLRAMWGFKGGVFYAPFAKFHEVIINTINGSKKLITLVMVARECGKALALDTPIPTIDGWTTMGELRVGDRIWDEMGLPCNVTFATDVQYGRKCYRVEFSDGQSIVADADHQWSVCDRWKNRRRWGGRSGGFTILTTKDMVGKVNLPSNRERNEHRYSIPLTKPLQPMPLPTKKLLIHPYLLGVWLGDGTSASSRMTCGDHDTALLELVRKTGCTVEKANQAITYVLGRGYLHSQLKKLNLLNNKHIPTEYLRAPFERRLQLLQGLMDTDGYITKRGYCEITLKNNGIIVGIKDLLSSLGIKFTVSDKYVNCNGKRCGPYKRFLFSTHNDMPVFRLSRKLSWIKDSSLAAGSKNRFITNIVPVDSVPVKCIQVDSPSSLYLAGEGMVPTHNTKLLSFGYIIWAVAFKRYGYILHISFSLEGKGEQIMRDLQRGFLSPRFMRFFGDWRGKFWGKHKIHLFSDRWKIDCIIEVKGADQSVFGASEWKSRPELIIIDDIEDLKMVKNAEIIAALVEKFHTEIIPAAEAKDQYGRQAKIIIIGTPLATYTFLTEIASQRWKNHVMLLKIPILVDNATWPGMSEILGIPEGRSIWEERFSTKELESKRAFFVETGGYSSWLLQYMMDYSSDQPMQFAPEKVKEVEFKDIQPLISRGRVVHIVDMAYTEKRQNDFVGIDTALHLPGSRIIHLESSQVKVSPDKLFDILYALKEKYKMAASNDMFCESKQYQWVKQYFWEVEVRTGRHLGMGVVSDKNINPNDRIGAMIPFYEVGLLEFVTGKNKVLLFQMGTWKGKTVGHDDVIAAAAYQTRFVELSEDMEVKKEVQNEEIDDELADMSVELPEKTSGKKMVAQYLKRSEEKQMDEEGEDDFTFDGM
jgi:hypothetical protein